jgi:uncharacterized membrane protein YphA (DoxX/SURF4 family)
MKASHFPLRVAIGAYFLNSGLSKWSLEGQAVESVHGMAVGAVPALNRVAPRTFARLLAGSEIVIGTAMLLPMVPSALVGAGLCGFAGGLLRLYWATPGMHAPGDPRPTQQGAALAKDVWLAGAGLTLILDDLGDGLSRARRRPGGRGGAHRSHQWRPGCRASLKAREAHGPR